jgi:predicted nuclease of restriction endonuclease-like (RecB) superfamily
MSSAISLDNTSQIQQMPSAELALPHGKIQQTASAELILSPDRIQQMSSAEFKLSWSHYQVLMRIEDVNARSFYEIESADQQWSVEQLKRQYHSSLYERLALSRDKTEVMRLANEGQVIRNPKDLLKTPLILDFLGMDEKSFYTESDMETAIISKLQSFLLELGKGFLFEARQKRFTYDEQNFFVDLVFYNRLLQCYVLIDIKTNELKHQDIGQMQMYVNYYDRNVKQDFEKPSIGILLCKEKNDSIVQMTLPENANIYASEYNLYLPDKKLLQQKLQEWTEEFKSGNV